MQKTENQNERTGNWQKRKDRKKRLQHHNLATASLVQNIRKWLRTTQEFYNRIAEFYYNLLLDHTDLWEMGSQQTLRELEIMSIPGRGGRIPSDPLPWQKVPLYFRRAAANEGIASAKSYLSRFARMRRSAERETKCSSYLLQRNVSGFFH